MNRYADLKQRQQEEFGAFPMQFAFSDRQFAEAMAALGLEPTDMDKICKAPRRRVLPERGRPPARGDDGPVRPGTAIGHRLRRDR